MQRHDGLCPDCRVYLYNFSTTFVTYVAALKEEIAALRRHDIELWKKQDAEGIASLYADDGMLMTTGTDVVHGKKGTRSTAHSPKNSTQTHSIISIFV